MASTNFITIRQRVCDKLYAGRRPIRGTATGGSTSTVVDSGHALSGATADRFDHHWIKIATSTDGAAPQPQVRQISEGGYTAASGTFTVPSVFTAAVAAGDTYEIHELFHPDEIDTIANDFLRQLWVPTHFPLSAQLLVNDDNDMESTATITGMWSNSSGTLTKATSPLMDGAQVLKVAATAANGYAFPLANFSCNPNLQYVTAALCAVTDGDSARLRLIDVTNTATIDETAAVTLTDWQEMVIQWTPPSGCRSMQARLMSVADTDESFWDQFQTWVLGRYSYILPSWISMRQQVIKIVGYRIGDGSIGGDMDYIANRSEGIPLPWSFDREDWAGTNEVRVHVDCPSGYRPFIVARKPVTAVSYDYGTDGTGTTANTVPLTSQQVDMVVMGVYGELCRRLSLTCDEEDRANYVREALRGEAQYRAGVKQFGLGEPVSRQTPQRIAAVMR